MNLLGWLYSPVWVIAGFSRPISRFPMWSIMESLVSFFCLLQWSVFLTWSWRFLSSSEYCLLVLSASVIHCSLFTCARISGAPHVILSSLGCSIGFIWHRLFFYRSTCITTETPSLLSSALACLAMRRKSVTKPATIFQPVLLCQLTKSWIFFGRLQNEHQCGPVENVDHQKIA